jgi:hypothetical protein
VQAPIFRGLPAFWAVGMVLVTGPVPAEKPPSTKPNKKQTNKKSKKN